MSSGKSLVIIVEDAPDQVQLLSGYLRAQSQDTDILSAPTVKQAIELISKTQPKMVILDLVLEDGSGEEVLKYVKETQPQVPVLIVTGDRSEETLARLFDAGAHDYITKPVDDLIFRSKARSLLSSRYISPLNFLGRRDGLGMLQVRADLKVIKLNETEAVFISSFHLAPGGLFFVTFKQATFQVRVRNYSPVPGKGTFRIECQVVPKSMTNPVDLRRAIYTSKLK
ncbi:response regulator [Bdellovibrio sp. SKB1291214]|uniref:response regulator n=1 Tax=Bdellovibrio sp. SKB1291214 TaxID=1732569 RepID=UPI000B51A53E|nr:response regulator [Bdellovibrio sp. SKB1291214]UYL07411.1 response regulator [Bdellovibrio sp. SKB1291214]